jgi:hypothetical protein
MSMQNKPQMVEAVVFFNERGVCKEMLFPEFEALLDGVVNMPEFADEQVRMVYVLINPRLLVRAAVFFYLDFDESGAADRGWNLPLRHLADRAGRGPDLGAGPIRLACRSQCPVSWHQMHLWDPSLAPGRNDLVLLRDTVKRNGLGLLVEDDAVHQVNTDRLQVAAEDRWQAPDASRDVAEKAAEKEAGQKEREHRLKTAQLIKQQRLRISSLGQQYEEELAKAKLLAAEQQKKLQREIQALRQALQQQEALNASLKQQLVAQGESFQKVREDMTHKLRALEQHARTEADILRAQFEGELRAKVIAATAEFREQVAIRDVELAYRGEQDSQLQQEVVRLKRERDEFAGQGGEQTLERLSRLGVVFVVYHPGAGHLTLPLQDIARYQDNPLGYVAAKCFVSESQYKQWLSHYKQPVCEAALPSGEHCAIPIERVENPSRFAVGDSNCCNRHKASNRLRTVS